MAEVTTDREILEKAMMIALNNGFSQRAEEPDFYMFPEALIFRRDFAKALWGEAEHTGSSVGTDDYGSWGPCKHCEDTELTVDYCSQYKLAEMVISEDPIKYLGENI